MSIFTYKKLIAAAVEELKCCLGLCKQMGDLEVSESPLAEGDLTFVRTEEGVCLLKPYDATGALEVCTIAKSFANVGNYDRSTDVVFTIRTEGETSTCVLTVIPTFCEQLNALPIDDPNPGGITRIPYVVDTGDGVFCGTQDIDILLASNVCESLQSITQISTQYDITTDVIPAVRTIEGNSECVGIILPTFCESFSALPVFADEPIAALDYILVNSGAHDGCVKLQLSKIDYALLAVIDGYHGYVEQATLGETLVYGDLVYFNNVDNRWYFADASTATTSANVKLGICITPGNAGDTGRYILIWGKIRAGGVFPALTASQVLYVSTTAGDITQTAPSSVGEIKRTIGHAEDLNTIWFTPSNDWTVIESDFTVVHLTFADSPYTIVPTTGRYKYLINTTGGDVEIELPTAVGTTAEYTFKKISNDANDVNVNANGVELIDDDNVKSIAFQFTAFSIFSDNTQYWID